MSLFEVAYENIKEKYPDLAAIIDNGSRQEIGSAFTEILENSATDPLLMKDIIDIISDRGCEKAVPVLLSLAKSKNTQGNVKRACVNCLKNFNCEESLNALSELLGVSNSDNDKWVRQLATQSLSSMIRKILRTDPVAAKVALERIRKENLSSDNSFTRMNSAIVLRNIHDEKALPYLKDRLTVEKNLIKANKGTIGTPFVIKELEAAISKLSP